MEQKSRDRRETPTLRATLLLASWLPWMVTRRLSTEVSFPVPASLRAILLLMRFPLSAEDDHATKDDPTKTHNVDEAVKSDSSAQSDAAIHPVPADASKLTGDHTIPLVDGTSSQHLIT